MDLDGRSSTTLFFWGSELYSIQILMNQDLKCFFSWLFFSRDHLHDERSPPRWTMRDHLHDERPKPRISLIRPTSETCLCRHARSPIRQGVGLSSVSQYPSTRRRTAMSTSGSKRTLNLLLWSEQHLYHLLAGCCFLRLLTCSFGTEPSNMGRVLESVDSLWSNRFLGVAET